MLQQLNTVLACLSQPAFVRDRETIRLSNEAAARLGLLVGSDNIPVELPPVDSAGSSCSCCVGGLTWQAQIRPVEDLQLVILEQVDEADAAVIAAAARALREPLQQISMTASQLWPYLEEQEDEKIQRGTAAISRGVHRMLRAVWNLSDLHMPDQSRFMRRKRTECGAFLEDLSRRAEPLIRSAGRRLELEYPSQRGYATIDQMMVERALLNLLLNALQHTPEGGRIMLRGTWQKKLCCFTVENEGEPISESSLAGLFNRYKRPELALQTEGAGLGLSIVRTVAQTHGGSLLAQPRPEGGLLVSMRIERDEIRFGEDPVCSPVQIEWSGGFDRCLTELADALPDREFDSRGVDLL